VPDRRTLTAVVVALAGAGALVVPVTASATGVSRTWIYGLGDDTNATASPPCSRVAPCQTLNGALAVTSPTGEIDVLAAGEFGPAGNTGTGPTSGAVSITQWVTVLGGGVTAAVSPATATDAIDINAPGAIVRLIGLTINGDGTGVVGVKVLAAKQVWIEDSKISGFTGAGIEFAPSDTTSQLYVDGSTIDGNGDDGVVVAPPNGNSDSALLTRDTVEDNGCGIVASSAGYQSGTVTCGTSPSPSAPGGTAELAAINDSINDNTGAGVLAGGSAAGATIASDVISGNGTGLQEAGGGQIASLGALELSGNTTNGSPTSTTVEVGPAGAQGAPSDSKGAPGTQGGQGERGASGPDGSAGKTLLVTCTSRKGAAEQKCTVKLVTSVGGHSRDAVTAVIARDGKVYARGKATRAHGRLRLVLHRVRRPTSGGRYTLTLSRGHRVIARRTIRIAVSRG
jgi:hypothetical protein